ncbi:Mus7/MMS22 family-domain-containing protein [Fusarium acuminatum]|uniref:Mus7/MMS22 family-domain-containing protein n=1 Tax=Fusarium acuminatum TaxID=5515 RepID=A0ABZ2X5F4_9HYPO
MSNWKELGEVPDSEEEDGFESQELPSLPATTSTSKNDTEQNDDREQGTVNHDKEKDQGLDIWDVPDSSQDLAQQAPLAKTPSRIPGATTKPPETGNLSFDELNILSSSPLSSVHSDADLPDVDTFDLQRTIATTSAKPKPSNEAQQNPSASTGVLESYVERSSPPPEFTTNNRNVIHPSSSLILGDDHAVPMQSQELGDEAEHQAARQTVVRNERSLRPRKPIQERPYAIEMSYYSNILKRHGVRPLRLAIEGEKRRRQQAEQEASQDKDFEDDSQGSHLPDVSDESQLKSLEDFLDGLDTIGDPSPSPPKTSPMVDRAGPSSQASSTGDTENTSMAGDDLPTLKDLLRRPPTTTSKQHGKRKPSPSRSSARKRKRYDVVDSDPLEPASAFRLGHSATDSPAAQRSSRRNGDDSVPPVEISEQETHSPLVATGQAQSYLRLTQRPAMASMSDSEDELAGPATSLQPDGEGIASQSDSESGSESGSEIVNTVGRRIRGVLPASWLRLDQQAGPKKPSKDLQKRPAAFSPEREIRRGVAQRRVASPNVSKALEMFFEESDDDDISAPTTTSGQQTTDDVFHNQTRLNIIDEPPIYIPEDLSDDEGSVVEDNAVDPMSTGRKRQMKLSDSFNSTAKRRKSSDTSRKQSAPKGPHQPMITSMLSGTRGASVPAAELIKKKYRQPTLKRKSKGGKRSKTDMRRSYAPPRLSILDVVEPNAPRFLKIAARSATQRQDMGRSSPSRKVIRLATREDHIDVTSVLSNWRSGLISQRQSVTAARKAKTVRSKPTMAKPPLRETSGNGSSTPRRVPVPQGASRRLVKQVSQAGSIRYQTDSNVAEPQVPQHRRTSSLARSGSGVTRPAQLESDETDPTSRLSFNATKRRLDRLYRKQRGDFSASSIMTFDNGPDTFYPASPPPEENPIPLRAIEEPLQDQNKSRFRKKIKPQRIDVEAPQFSRANDPIPSEAVQIHELVQSVETNGEKLQGLGPYGTQYTHHFETFPLDCRVYFHESTLLGSGALETASKAITCQYLFESRPRLPFNFGEQVLRWGPWDAQVSSEMGVLLDSLADQIERALADGEDADPKLATSAAGFVMKFILNALSLADPTQAKSFVCRVIEVLKGFNARINALLDRHSSITTNNNNSNNNSTTQPRYSLIASVYDHFLVATLFVLRLCQGETSLMGEQFQMEDLLKGLAKTAITSLITTGIAQIANAYDDLKSPRIRERGLRDDMPIIHSWVVNMKVLEHAHVLRASFWDILYTVMATPEMSSSLDVTEHERLWKNMFLLLPLAEFNDKGIIVAGRRHETAVDGWSLPQKLLKKVFQVYKDNPRQSPSFNNYCRALVGRCHYLVQQWGWRKCVAVIGVIFDFFGSQNLAHLRNEEAYASPKFLDELAGNPSLSVDKSDKCFHIFLKLVALSIKKLSDIGALKDIRNLIARTMPNHNRQLLKEQMIQERDLAALRNHHDLLCTLFWASPGELRPGAHLIERLVTPASSHKEACLINLRAWSQLAKFIISSGEATTSFRPFTQWRNNFFQSMMQQFDSVQSDMQQQVLAMSKDATSTIDPHLINSMVAMNRRAVMDVLYASVAASLDVMRHAPNLEAATHALNTLQLEEVFRRSSAYPPELDWSILRTSLSTLDVFFSRVTEFNDDEESQQSECQILNSAQADDALLVVDQNLSKVYFSMARCVLSSEDEKKESPSTTVERSQCTEQVVTLTARLAVRFINGGLFRLVDMFKNGKYGLFNDVPAKISLDQRRHLVLFMTTLLKHDFDDFTNAGFSLSEVWVLSIVKPRPYLSYENQLAEQLRRLEKEFVPEAVTGLTINPDYNTNRDLFEFAISWMRKSLRDAGPALRKVIMAEHSKTLKLVMQQIQSDLRAMSHIASEHSSYVVFVRDIIGLIRAHGSDLCTIDKYFYQISKEYSPSIQDPQLQVAGMTSYGLRLSEGDVKIVQQVFYFLSNNFKMSLKDDKLREEVQLLQKGMENPGIFSFILGKMLPAIIHAAAIESLAFPMVEAYTEALRVFLTRAVIPRELAESDMPQLLALLRAIAGFMDQLSQTDRQLQPPQLHLVTQLLALSNNLWPSVYALSISGTSCGPWQDIVQALRDMRTGFLRAEPYVADMIDVEDYSLRAEILLSGFGKQGIESTQVDKDVKSFTNNLVNDVRKIWVTSGTRISIQAPGRGPGFTQTQTSQGVPMPVWEPEVLVNDVYEELRRWNNWWNTVFGERQVPANPDAAPCRNLVVHGATATGKSAIVSQLVSDLVTNVNNDASSGGLQAANVSSVQCITGRHLFESIVGQVAEALQWEEIPRRCETLAQLTVEMVKMIQYPKRDARWRFVLVLDAIDRQRDAPPTLLPALARLSEIIPCLTCVFIVTSPPASFLRSPSSAHLLFPPYEKKEFVRIAALTPPKSLPTCTQQETTDLWTRFCAAVYDSLTKSASRTLPSFKHSCNALWPRFTAPIVAGTHLPKEFSKLLIAGRVHFQDESLLNPSIVSVRPKNKPVDTAATKPTSSATDLTNLLPTTARLLLLAAYLASHNATRHDLTLFSTYHHGRKRRRGGIAVRGGTRTKHRKIARKLLGAHAFVLERMMAIFAAVRSEWADGTVVGASGLDADVAMAISTLASLRLLTRVGGAGDVMDRGGKWRINVAWEVIRGIGRSIGVEVEEWLID